MLTRIPFTQPRRVAAETAAIIGRSYLYKPVNWIDVPAGTFTAADMRAEAGTGDCRIVTGVAGWAAILTVPGDAEFDMSAPPGQNGPDLDSFIVNGQRRHITWLAVKALRLNAADASWLLAEYRTLAEAAAALESIASGQPMRRIDGGKISGRNG